MSGQKGWTTLAHRADWIQLFVRTDVEGPKYRGLSCVLVDMKSRGITVRPLRQMTGESEFNEVFFEDVRVPNANLLGPLNGGWQVPITTLMHERTGIGDMGAERIVDDLIDLARRLERDGKPAAKDPYVRQRLAQLAIEAQARKLNGLRGLTKRLKGEAADPRGRSASSSAPSSISGSLASPSSSPARARCSSAIHPSRSMPGDGCRRRLPRRR